jgi:hypothetical protein
MPTRSVTVFGGKWWRDLANLKGKLADPPKKT